MIQLLSTSNEGDILEINKNLLSKSLELKLDKNCEIWYL